MRLLSRRGTRSAGILDGPLRVDAVDGRQILPAVTVLLVAQLVQEHALPVRTLLVAEPSGAILGRAQLGSEHPIAVLRAIHGLDAPGGVLLLLERDVDTQRLVLAIVAFAAADRNLEDVAVLTEELGPAEGLEQLLLADSRCQTGHINQVLLNDPNANEVFAILPLGLASLRFLLALFLRTLFLVFLYIRSKLGNSRWRQQASTQPGADVAYSS